MMIQAKVTNMKVVMSRQVITPEEKKRKKSKKFDMI